MRISAADFEPNLTLVPSVLFNGKRVRTLYDTLHCRPPGETFHEFLIATIQWTFGEAWWKHQVGAGGDARHAVVAWYLQYCEFTRTRTNADARGPDALTYSAPATGPLWALLTLGYDLFCLQLKRELPTHVVAKLRDRSSYQSMRYEVAAAAILLRAGFDIEFLDEHEIGPKHGEFLVRRSGSAQAFVVEAKSRVRSGVLHRSGTFHYTRDVRGLEDLVRDALQKHSDDLPFVVFLDVNLPPTPEVTLLEKSWIRDIKGVLSFLGTPTEENPDRFSLLVVTNFAYHLGAADDHVPRPEWVVILPQFPTVALEQSAVGQLHGSLQRYGVVPTEL
jgi:hypothetical protein